MRGADRGRVRRRRISSPLRKPREVLREVRSIARAFQTRRSRAKAISAHPGPGGVAGITGDVRRLDEYAPGILSAHRGRIPRANSGRSEHWLAARVEQYVEQCGAVWNSVDVSFRDCSSCHGSNISWPAHPTDTLQPIFAVNLRTFESAIFRISARRRFLDRIKFRIVS